MPVIFYRLPACCTVKLSLQRLQETPTTQKWLIACNSDYLSVIHSVDVLILCFFLPIQYTFIDVFYFTCSSYILIFSLSSSVFPVICRSTLISAISKSCFNFCCIRSGWSYYCLVNPMVFVCRIMSFGHPTTFNAVAACSLIFISTSP